MVRLKFLVCITVYVSLESDDHANAVARYRGVLYKLSKADPVHIVTDNTATIPTGCATSVLNTTCQIHVQLKVCVCASVFVHGHVCVFCVCESERMCKCASVCVCMCVCACVCAFVCILCV